MIYDIRHVTSYSYESPVSFARCSLRLEPKSGGGQQLVSHTVDIRPRPADRTVRSPWGGHRAEIEVRVDGIGLHLGGGSVERERAADA